MNHVYGDSGYTDAADREDRRSDEKAARWAEGLDQDMSDTEWPLPLMRCPSCNEPLLTNVDRVFRWHTTTPNGYSCYRRAMEVAD